MNSAWWQWIIDRLSENSTWRGIAAAGAAFGLVADEKKVAAICLGVIAVINIVRPASPTRAEVEQSLETKEDKKQ